MVFEFALQMRHQLIEDDANAWVVRTSGCVTTQVARRSIGSSGEEPHEIGILQRDSDQDGTDPDATTDGVALGEDVVGPEHEVAALVVVAHRGGRPDEGVVAIIADQTMVTDGVRRMAVMYAFVVSEAHAAAIAAVGEVSRGGSVVMHWNEADAERIDFDNAAQQLADHMGPTY